MVNPVDSIKETALPIVEGYGAEIVEITYKREAGAMVLRLLVDKEGGISIQECSSINGQLGNRLDELNIIADHYLLEVSSPGIDRLFSSRRDYERNIGNKIEVVTKEAVEGKRITFVGTLAGMSEGSFALVDDDDVTFEIGFDNVRSAKAHIDF